MKLKLIGELGAVAVLPNVTTCRLVTKLPSAVSPDLGKPTSVNVAAYISSKHWKVVAERHAQEPNARWVLEGLAIASPESAGISLLVTQIVPCATKPNTEPAPV